MWIVNSVRSSVVVSHLVPGGTSDKLLNSICSGEEPPNSVIFYSYAHENNREFLSTRRIELFELHGRFKALNYLRSTLRLLAIIKSRQIKVLFLHSFYLTPFIFLNFIQRKCFLIPVRHHNRVHRIFQLRKGIVWDYVVSKLSPHIVAVSKAVKKQITSEGGNPERVSIIRNGINVTQFQENDVRVLKRSCLQEFKIILVGRIEQQKNYTMLLNVASLARDAHLNFTFDIYGVGSREEEALLVQNIESLGLKGIVFFKGWHPEVVKLFNEYCIFMHVAIDEAFPVVIMEALCSGIPVVSSPLGGSIEVLEGFIEPVSEYSASAFLDKLRQVAMDYEGQFELMQSIRQHAIKRFDEQIMANKYSDLAKQFANRG